MAWPSSSTRRSGPSPRVNVKRVTAAVALVGAVAAGVVLSATVAFGRPILASRWSLLEELALWGVLWVLAVVLVFRVSPRVGMAVIVVGAIGLRLAALAGPPVTSDDLYRYSWDGRVQAAGIDPYAYPPTSAALVRLRDPWLWPDAAGCTALHRPAGCTRINRPGQRTIYPPLAEGWFAVAYRLGGSGARYKTWQVAGLLTDLGAVGLLIVGLGRYGRDRRWAALYALSPAPVLEIVNNGHVDGLGIVLLLGALVVAGGSGAGRGWRDVAAGVLIGAAVLVKLYPAVALVALTGGVGVGARSRWSVVRAGAAAALVCAVAYLPHVVRVGARVLGYLPGYLREEHYAGGGRFLIAAALHGPGHSAAGASILGLLGVAAWVWWRRPPAPAGTALLLGALLLATSPVQPWYAVSLLAVARSWPPRRG